jgi:hypothetical protein
MSIPDLYLKQLPDGMHYEERPDGVYIAWPGHGAMSIDLTRRCFTFGIDSGRFLNRQPGAYNGKGWKDRLIDDAVAALMAPWRP